MTYLSFIEYSKLNDLQRKRYVSGVEEALKGDFALRSLGEGPAELPVFEQAESSIAFVLIPAGEFAFGLTEEEEVSARAICDPPNLTFSELRPARRVPVHSFLISRTPVLIGDARRLINASQLEYPIPGAGGPYAPAFVLRDVALSCATKLGCELPSEIEWEYSCRANASSLFAWGDRLLSERELSPWLDYRSLPPHKWRKNGFGLQMLFTGEWCIDEWTPTHEEGAEVSRGVHVVKGGGSLFWPWQSPDEQFVWCMPAMRIPSTNTGGARCSFRLVKALPK